MQFAGVLFRQVAETLMALTSLHASTLIKAYGSITYCKCTLPRCLLHLLTRIPRPVLVLLPTHHFVSLHAIMENQTLLLM